MDQSIEIVTYVGRDANENYKEELSNQVQMTRFVLASVRTVPKYSLTRTRSNPQGLE